MNWLSLFDGISCGQIAIKELGLRCDNYFASEINKDSISVCLDNFPNTIHVGDVTKLHFKDGVLSGEFGEYEVGKIDILIGGSPCQGFSISGSQLNFDDPRSRLFFEYKRLLDEINPTFFFLENVKMKNEYRDIISEIMGVEPKLINSANYTPASRNRYYWTNIDVRELSEPNDLTLNDLLGYDPGVPEFDEIYPKIKEMVGETSKYYDNFILVQDSQQRYMVLRPDGLKIQRIGRVAVGGSKLELLTKSGSPKLWDGENVRILTRNEAEFCQSVPMNYTKVVSENSAIGLLGDGWTVSVIEDFFYNLPEEYFV